MNKNVQSLLDRIADLERDYLEARRVYYATVDPLKKKVAVLLCPFAIKDLVVDKYKVEYVVTRIAFSGSVSRPSFELFGRKVLKSRALHKLEQRFYSFSGDLELTKIGTYDAPF